MDAKREIREFLTTRRARITPDQASLPVYGDNRRVPGLRREEVALLAGVSVDYYTRLERGALSGASESVLEAIARALKLDDAERSHLFDLARASQASAPRRRRRREQIRPTVQRILDAMTGAPAFVRNGRLDLLAANHLGQALYPQFERDGSANTARFVFLDPRSRDFYLEWGHVADEVVAMLRSEAGRDPYDKNLTELVGALSTQSEEFRTRWGAHNVRFHDTGLKRIHHPVVGELELTYESFELAGQSGLAMFAYTAEPGSKSEEGLRLLGSWSATTASASSTPSRAR